MYTAQHCAHQGESRGPIGHHYTYFSPVSHRTRTCKILHTRPLISFLYGGVHYSFITKAASKQEGPKKFGVPEKKAVLL